MGRHPPCLNAPCGLCSIDGKRLGTRTIVPGAILAVSAQNPNYYDLKRRYAKEFRHVPGLEELAHQPRPAKRRKVDAVAAGRRVETKRSKKDEEPFCGVDVFTQRLPYHDKTKHVFFDIAHEVFNSNAEQPPPR